MKTVFAIGCDIVAVKRIRKFERFSRDKLTKIFSEEELDYCKADWASLAARFAAKEAFFKAFSSLLVKLKITSHEFSLLFLCKHVSVDKTTWDVPSLKVNWEAIEKKIQQKLPVLEVELSIAHENDFAVAYVVMHGAAHP